MKIFIFALTAGVLIINSSCSNRKVPADIYQRDVSTYSMSEDTILVDSVISETKEKEIPKTKASSYNNGKKEKELDNMRGFDPASEDDMDDNGMQRYFDANDEEAWD